MVSQGNYCLYIWVAMRGLAGIEVKWGLDKNFPQVAFMEAFFEEAHFSPRTREMGHPASVVVVKKVASPPSFPPGGRFAPVEQPAAVAQDMTAFF